RVAARLVEELGGEAVEAGSGEAAIAELRRRRFDLVLMDCMMPGMDGFEATARIREPGSGVLDPGLPIVALTARTQAEDRARCLASGMADYIAKPLTSLGLRQVLVRLAAATVASGAQEATGRSFDPAEFASRYEGAPELAAEIIGLFLEQSLPLCDRAAECLRVGDLEGFASALHRLKGSAGAIGAPGVADSAEALLGMARGLGEGADSGCLAPGMEALGCELKALETELRGLASALGRPEATPKGG
ncbi:MAG TPA: response regulator, partial [Rectinemataceae bacterium]|nr:response regulator [Rectinemataceae bacterium]